MAIEEARSFDVENGFGPGGTDAPKLFSGTGAPTHSATNGSLFLRDNSTLYRRESGVWVVKTFGSGAGTFGDFVAYGESEAESQTTSLSYVQKLRVTTSSVDAGEYLINWNCEVKNPNGNSKSMDLRVQVDDATDINEGTMNDGGTDWTFASGFRRLTLTNAVHNIDLDFKQNTATAFIRRARIIVWRA